MFSFLEHISCHQKCIPFFAQVLCGMASRLEEVLLRALRSGAQAGTSLNLCFISILDVIENTRHLCNELVKHAFAGQKHFEKFSSLSMCMDKAQVSGLGLYAGAILAPDGHASLSVIQVALGCARGLPISAYHGGRHRARAVGVFGVYRLLVYTQTSVFLVYTNLGGAR